MALTQIDPDVALVVIDLQQGVVRMPTVHPAAEVTARAAELARAFRRKGRPVVLVNVTGGAPGRTEQARPATPFPADFAELVPDLERQESDHVVTKRTWGAFTGTDLDAHLKSLGVTQIVLAGISTSAGVESTARHAHELGFHVTLATDAMTDRDAAAHANSIARVFPRIGETGSTAEIIALLDRKAA